MDPGAPRDDPHLVFVVPLYNEVALVEAVADAYLEALARCPCTSSLVLVDNGSTDGTSRKVAELAATRDPVIAVHLSPNQGYGGGILDGLDAGIAASQPTLVGWGWGDGQVSPAVLPELVEACLGGAALAKVVRIERQDGARRRIITGAYHAVLRLLGVALPDVNGCPKVLQREVFDDLSPAHRDWFLDPEVVLGALDRDLLIHTAPATMRPRAAGRSKVKASTLAEFVGNLARWRLRRG